MVRRRVEAESGEVPCGLFHRSGGLPSSLFDFPDAIVVLELFDLHPGAAGLKGFAIAGTTAPIFRPFRAEGKNQPLFRVEFFGVLRRGAGEQFLGELADGYKVFHEMETVFMRVDDTVFLIFLEGRRRI
jgi:hypothetical protein